MGVRLCGKNLERLYRRKAGPELFTTDRKLESVLPTRDWGAISSDGGCCWSSDVKTSSQIILERNVLQATAVGRNFAVEMGFMKHKLAALRNMRDYIWMRENFLYGSFVRHFGFAPDEVDIPCMLGIGSVCYKAWKYWEWARECYRRTRNNLLDYLATLDH